MKLECLVVLLFFMHVALSFAARIQAWWSVPTRKAAEVAVPTCSIVSMKTAKVSQKPRAFGTTGMSLEVVKYTVPSWAMSRSFA